MSTSPTARWMGHELADAPAADPPAGGADPTPWDAGELHDDPAVAETVGEGGEVPPPEEPTDPTPWDEAALVAGGGGCCCPTQPPDPEACPCDLVDPKTSGIACLRVSGACETDHCSANGDWQLTGGSVVFLHWHPTTGLAVYGRQWVYAESGFTSGGTYGTVGYWEERTESVAVVLCYEGFLVWATGRRWWREEVESWPPGPLLIRRHHEVSESDGFVAASAIDCETADPLGPFVVPALPADCAGTPYPIPASPTRFYGSACGETESTITYGGVTLISYSCTPGGGTGTIYFGPCADAPFDEPEDPGDPGGEGLMAAARQHPEAARLAAADPLLRGGCCG